MGIETWRIWPDQLIIPRENRTKALRVNEYPNLKVLAEGTTRYIDKNFPTKNTMASNADTKAKNFNCDVDTIPHERYTLKIPDKVQMP